MSIPVVKWIPSAPKQLKVGMVLKAGKEVVLVGSGQYWVGSSKNMPNGVPIEAHGQLVDAYVLEWLGNDGIVKGVSR